MGELGFIKFFGAALATFLFIFALNEVATYVFGGGGHHDDHHYESQNDWAAAKFHGYRIDIAETSSGGGEEEGPVFDLGLMLAGADPAAGETVLKRQCATCHTWNEGGANGTGPNLHGVIGNDIASASGFNYSGALSGIEGEWSYDQMNAWLTNPGSFARGTSMAYAGLRSPRRDKDRVNVIAYLASTSAGAPAFPAPLATDTAAEESESNAVEGTVTETDEATEPVIEAVEGAEDASANIIIDAANEATESLVETATDAATGTLEGAAEDAGSNLLDQAVDTAEDIVEDATDGEH